MLHLFDTCFIRINFSRYDFYNLLGIYFCFQGTTFDRNQNFDVKVVSA